MNMSKIKLPIFPFPDAKPSHFPALFTYVKGTPSVILSPV